MNTESFQQKLFKELNNKEFFQHAHNHVQAYLDSAKERVVYPLISAIENLDVFDEHMPIDSNDGKDIIELLSTVGSQATINTLNGRYFGFVTGASLPVGMATKHLTTYWDQNSALHAMSPIASRLETIVETWLKDIFHLPKTTVAGFVSGTSMANFCGLAAARYRLLERQGWDINKQGLSNAPTIRIVTSKQAHSTVIKTISLLGLGINQIEWVDVDNQGRIRPDLLPSLDNSTIVILQAGNVNSGAFDPFKLICEKARKVNAWVHIDGAFGLWAAATKKFKYLTDGMNMAHSFAVDAHKTLNTPYDSGIILCNDQEALAASLHMDAGYIIKSSARDGMYFTPEMSRRARIFELWATLKYLGKTGINDLINLFHDRALQFSNAFNEIEGFEVINEVHFNQVLVTCNDDDLTSRVLSIIQEERTCWVGESLWNNKRVIRVSICAWTTTKKDVELSILSFKKALRLSLKE